MRKALVAGALGIVGGSVIDELLAAGNWSVVGLSRHAPEAEHRYTHVCVDLRQETDCAEKLGTLLDVDCIFYAARAPSEDPEEEERVNLAMLRNLLEAVERRNPDLRHINIVHGSKWYGSQFGPYKTPARETDPRGFGRNFYYAQQEYIEGRQKRAGWTWSTVRPHGVFSSSLGSRHSIMAVLAVYAAISRKLGIPLRFPGLPGCFSAISQATDAALLARSMIWMASDPASANQAFNVSNGDVFRWQNVWPRIAESFSMEVGDVQTVRLESVMPGMKDIWNALCAEHSLRPHPYEDLAHWAYGDRTLAVTWDNIYSLSKLREFGFHEYVDTEEMILRQLAEFRSAGVIP